MEESEREQRGWKMENEQPFLYYPQPWSQYQTKLLNVGIFMIEFCDPDKTSFPLLSRDKKIRINSLIIIYKRQKMEHTE